IADTEAHVLVIETALCSCSHEELSTVGIFGANAKRHVIAARGQRIRSYRQRTARDILAPVGKSSLKRRGQIEILCAGKVVMHAAAEIPKRSTRRHSAQRRLPLPTQI